MKNPAPKGDLRRWVSEATADCNSVIEFGSGMAERLRDVACELKVGVEIHEPYVMEAMRRHPEAIYLIAPAQLIASFIPDKSIDCVLMSDFLEHLCKVDGMKMIEEAKGIARVRVIVFGPCGEYPHPEGEKMEKWTEGMGGHRYQFHRSVWTPDDLPGFDVVKLPDYYRTREARKHNALFAIWEP